MSEAKHTPAVFAAARVLHEIDGRESMEVCDVKSADYFTDDAEAVLRAAGFPDLLRELQHAVRWFDQLTPADIQRYRAVIAKATGSAS